MRCLCGTLGLALMALAPRLPSSADAVDRLERTLVAIPASGIRVDATIAEVRIVGSARTNATVEIRRRAPSGAELAQFPAIVDDTSDPIRIAVVQAREGRDARLKSDVVIRVPASTRFDAVRVFEGGVRVSGLDAACDVDIRRGSIEATDLAGRVRLETGIGNIEVRNPTLAPGGMMRLRAFNGAIRVQFERQPANARILALTFNGTIASDIPLAMKDQFGPRFGETTLGTGDPVLSADVVTGDISIRVTGR